MTDAPQVHNADDLTVLYEELTFLVSQLNSDAPRIKKMYNSLEQTIAKQEAAAAKDAQAIDTATSAAVAKIQKESKAMLDAAAQHLAKAESVAQRCEVALSQIETMAKSIQSDREYQLSVDKRFAQLEAKLQATGMPSQPSLPRQAATSSSKVATSKSTTLISYFKENDFKVIDRRSSGGALWVLGTETELKQHVNYAVKHFALTDQCGYGSSKTTKGQPAWWTKDDK